MSDLDSILSSAQGGQLVANLSQRFGLGEEQIHAAVEALAAEEPQVFEKTLGALSTATRYSFFDAPDAACSDDSVQLGKDLLSELFGSPAATGQVLKAAARESGVRADILGQLLPILVSVLLSGLTKSINDKGLGGLLGGILGSLLGGARRAPRGDGADRRTPDPFDREDTLDVDSGRGEADPGLPANLDQTSVQEAIEEIERTLHVGQNPRNRPTGQALSDLENLVGQILGKR